MAVAPTGLIFKTLQFDGQSSGEYGVYITGQAVYNAPARDIEMVSIPGRNGAFALDHGRFENIEVTYPAGIFADNEADFATAVSDFRNYLCSHNGYVRLTDDYNPEEYRMAIYKSGLEVSPAQLKAGEFEITFDCKPQRWLMSGEAAIEVESGTTLLNPTMFDASPLLEVEGYGNIEIGGESILVGNAALGDILLNDGERWRTRTVPETQNANIALSLLDSGDSFQVKAAFAETGFSYKLSGIETAELSSSYGDVTAHFNLYAGVLTTYQELAPQTFVKGTSKTVHGNVAYQITANGGDVSGAPIVSIGIIYDGANTVTIRAGISDLGSFRLRNIMYGYNTINAYSTLSTANVPVSIDLESGDAYGVISGTPVDLNENVMLPVSLPKLKGGATEITFDNTITELKVTPRWWKV